jgi:hypothetical protein
MRVKNLLLVAGTAFVALGTTEMLSVHAAPISITNPSFEQPSVPKGSYTIEKITGWSVINTSSSGVFNPSSTSFNSVPDGSQTLYSNGATVFQQLPATLAPNTTYTLRLQVGRRLDYTNFPGFTVELRAGNTVIASANQTMVPLPAPGKFVPLTLSFTTPSNVPQGQKLEIRLKSVGAQTNFDNVKLDAVSGNNVQDRVNSYMKQAGLPTSAELGEERWINACDVRAQQGAGTFNRGVTETCTYQFDAPGWQMIEYELNPLENKHGRGSYKGDIIGKDGNFTVNEQQIGDKWKAAIDSAVKVRDIEAKQKLELEYQRHQQLIRSYSSNKNTFFMSVTANGGLARKSVIHVKGKVKLIRLQ